MCGCMNRAWSVIPLITGDEVNKFWKVKVKVKVGGGGVRSIEPF